MWSNPRRSIKPNIHSASRNELLRSGNYELNQTSWVEVKIPLIPRDVWPDPTAVKACSICTSLPEGLRNRAKTTTLEGRIKKDKGKERGGELRKRPESGERKRILAVSHGELQRGSGEWRKKLWNGSFVEECRRKAKLWCGDKKRGFLVAEEGFVDGPLLSLWALRFSLFMFYYIVLEK